MILFNLKSTLQKLFLIYIIIKMELWLILTIVFSSLLFILILILLRKFYFNAPLTPYSPSLTDKIVIVTGATKGIGKETAIDLLSKGATVILGCRSEERTLELINNLPSHLPKDKAHFIKLDVSDFDSIVKFSKTFKEKFQRFDYLINNAGGVFFSYKLVNNIENTFMSNHIGPFILTCMLLDAINNEGRVINVSSILQTSLNKKGLQKLYSDSINNDSYSFMQCYALSKIGNTYHAKQLDNYFKKHNINAKTASIHPGGVFSNIYDVQNPCLKIIKILLFPFFWYFMKDTKVGAQTTLHCAYIDYNLLNSGEFYRDCKVYKLAALHRDEDSMAEFMEHTKNLIYKNMNSVPPEISKYFGDEEKN
jgi:retinol dehydrogenase-12